MPLFAFFVANLVEEKPFQEANMDTPESVAIEITTDAVVVAVFGASTSTGLTAVHVKLKGRVLIQTMASKCAKPVPLVDTCIDL